MKSIRSDPAAPADDGGYNTVASSITLASTMGRSSSLSIRTDGNDNDDDSEGDRSHFSLSATPAPGRVGA